MRFALYLGCTLLAGTFAGGTASAANMCQAGKLSCATTMPVGGFCQCTAQGLAQSGTVVGAPAPGEQVNATAGGCGTQPNAPGCH